MEETAFNKFSNQNLSGSELPVQRYLVLIQKHVLWKFEESVHIVFTFFDKNDFEKPYSMCFWFCFPEYLRLC